MYTDPGLVQMLIASAVGALLGVPAYLFMIRHRIGAWWNERKNKKK